MNRRNNLMLSLAVMLVASACSPKNEDAATTVDSLKIDTNIEAPLPPVADSIPPPPPPVATPIGTPAPPVAKPIAPPPPPTVTPKSGTIEPPVATKSDNSAFFDANKMDVPPTPKNGTNNLRAFIAKNVKYPKAALDANIQGVVQVKFDVLADGSLDNVTVDRKLGGGLDEEAIRAVKASSPWNAGTVKGQAVHTSNYTVPVSFKLD